MIRNGKGQQPIRIIEKKEEKKQPYLTIQARVLKLLILLLVTATETSFGPSDEPMLDTDTVSSFPLAIAEPDSS